MRTDIGLRFRIGFALAGTALLAAFALLAVRIGTGALDDVYQLTATFDTSTQGLDDMSDVKARGVNVGTVEGVDLDERGRAVVTLRMRDGVKIADTTVASIEPLSIFGPKFVRLELGEHELDGPYLEPGDAIAETIAPLEFTEILGDTTRLLSAVDTDDLITIVQSLSDGLAGLGPEIGRTLDNSVALTELVEQNLPQTEQLLRDLAAVADTLSARGDELVSISDDLHTVLPDLTARSDQVTELLHGLSQVSSDVSDLLEGHAPALTDVLVGLESVSTTINGQRAQLPEFLSLLDTFFGNLSQVIRYPVSDRYTIATERGPLSSDPCQLFVGLLGSCPVPSSAQP